MAQVIALHEGVAFAGAQARPQPPQFERVRRSVSQPVATMLSQSPKPVSQRAIPQPVELHTPLLFGGSQRMPQPPQSVREVRRLTSQPLVSLPSQSAKPMLQSVTTQLRLTQDHIASPPPQGIPQPPQCAVLVATSTHEVPQTVPVGQSTAHVGVAPRVLQKRPAPHASPHEAQLVPSPSMVSQSGAVVSQSEKPVVHAYTQRPALQLGEVFSASQTVSQLPQ